MAARENSNWRPKAKREGWLIEKAGGEVVFYNTQRHRAHSLNESATRILDLCTGRRTVPQISAQIDLPVDEVSRELVVRDTLGQLERLGLIEANGNADFRISRRALVKRLGLGTATIIALPLITSLVAPTPAYAAASCHHFVCNPGTPCPTGCACPTGSGNRPCNPPCWIAAAVFDGWNDPRTVWVRHWLINDYAATFIGKHVVALYIRFGAGVAERVKRSPVLRRVFTVVFNVALHKAEATYGAIPS